MATTTNYSWTTPDDTDLVKDGASAIRSLGTAIDSTVFTNAGNAVQKSTIDAKGDLLVGTADNTITRLAVGTNNYVLTADSAEASGIKWAAAAGASYTWQNWTPTWTNLTLGNGTVIARYIQVDKLVSIYVKLTFGSTTSITGAPVQFSVPVNTTTDWQNLPIGMGQYYDTGTAAYIGWGYFEGANDKIGLYVAKVDTTYMNSQNGITATVPHTWANTDVISLTFTYEAA